MESGRWGNRDGGEKSGEIRDERALHILLYLSKQLASQPKVSSSLSLSLSFFLSPPLCQTDDRMWREGLERRDSWRWKDNGFWNAIALLTFGDFGVLCWCVCVCGTHPIPESHTDTRPDPTGFPLSIVQNFSMQVDDSHHRPCRTEGERYENI